MDATSPTQSPGSCAARPLVLALLFASVALAQADTVYLRSGEKVIGKITPDERTKLVIKSEALGKIEIIRERIERVEFDTVPGVSTNGCRPVSCPRQRSFSSQI